MKTEKPTVNVLDGLCDAITHFMAYGFTWATFEVNLVTIKGSNYLRISI